ncbi:acyl-CoA thioesterase [Streptacidiphilus sp. PB12-B1b]|uniref:acyl-CoA thioesterase n=1 Tax=Streptacidiphilus sp. PB12-B1b TaxID=2705012 RepID=UPI0015FB3772|nr:thioesterase family protein [Streptacidiphilus sp. PB12-B1b]QMU78300.1 acyl-CoA thioesterase [Streptacidiphilus sp. PB12-B1b]
MTAAASASRPVRRRIEHVDTDASGVVHFSRHLSLLESAVLEQLEQAGAGLQRLAEHGTGLAVASLDARYLRPCGYRDLVWAQVRITRVGAAGFRAEATLVREESDDSHTELSRGGFLFAAIDMQRGGPKPLPPAIRDVLKGIAVHAAPDHGSTGRPDLAAAGVPAGVPVGVGSGDRDGTGG